MSEEITVYVTKYALTTGIQEVSGTVGDFGGLFWKPRPYPQHFHGNDWHRTREAAVARAEEMRVAKIASLKRQLAKLEKKTFA